MDLKERFEAVVATHADRAERLAAIGTDEAKAA